MSSSIKLCTIAICCLDGKCSFFLHVLSRERCSVCVLCLYKVSLRLRARFERPSDRLCGDHGQVWTDLLEVRHEPWGPVEINERQLEGEQTALFLGAPMTCQGAWEARWPWEGGQRVLGRGRWGESRQKRRKGFVPPNWNLQNRR